jgi:hypothetical protein
MSSLWNVLFLLLARQSHCISGQLLSLCWEKGRQCLYVCHRYPVGDRYLNIGLFIECVLCGTAAVSSWSCYTWTCLWLTSCNVPISFPEQCMTQSPTAGIFLGASVLEMVPLLLSIHQAVGHAAHGERCKWPHCCCLCSACHCLMPEVSRWAVNPQSLCSHMIQTQEDQANAWCSLLCLSLEGWPYGILPLAPFRWGGQCLAPLLQESLNSLAEALWATYSWSKVWWHWNSFPRPLHVDKLPLDFCSFPYLGSGSKWKPGE